MCYAQVGSILKVVGKCPSEDVWVLQVGSCHLDPDVRVTLCVPCGSTKEEVYNTVGTVAKAICLLYSRDLVAGAGQAPAVLISTCHVPSWRLYRKQYEDRLSWGSLSTGNDINKNTGTENQDAQAEYVVVSS